MKIVNRFEEGLFQRGKKILERGGLVVYPTETFYGVGAKADSKKGVSKLLRFKGDRQGSISIAVSNREMAEEYALIEEEGFLYDQYLPGSVTIVSESRGVVDERLEAEDGSLGIRIPDYAFTLKMIDYFGFPITSTSANPSGGVPPCSSSDLVGSELIDLFIDGGELEGGLPSTVVRVTNGKVEVLRKGAVKKLS